MPSTKNMSISSIRAAALDATIGASKFCICHNGFHHLAGLYEQNGSFAYYGLTVVGVRQFTLRPRASRFSLSALNSASSAGAAEWPVTDELRQALREAFASGLPTAGTPFCSPSTVVCPQLLSALSWLPSTVCPQLSALN